MNRAAQDFQADKELALIQSAEYYDELTRGRWVRMTWPWWTESAHRPHRPRWLWLIGRGSMWAARTVYRVAFPWWRF